MKRSQPVNNNKPKKESEYVIGIDLGTTFSSLAYYDKTGPEVIIIGKDTSIPSWVSFDERNNSIVGFGAKNKSNSLQVLYDSKRIIGRSIEEIQSELRQNQWPFEIKEIEDKIKMGIILGNQKIEYFYPEEVSGYIVRELLNEFYNVKKHGKIINCFVGVPATFGDSQIEATKTACKLAGLNDVNIIREPIAGLIAYDKNYNINNGSKIIVVDFGGGTLDLAYCKKKHNGEITVIKTKCDQFHGGNDYDYAIKRIIIDKIIKLNKGIDESYFEEDDEIPIIQRIKVRERIKKLIIECERIKKELSENINSEVKVENIEKEDIDFVHNFEDAKINITREEFEKECEKMNLFDRFEQLLLKLKKESSIKIEDIDLILTIGGTCKIPKIRKIIEKIFPKPNAMSNQNFDMLTAVVQGACIKSKDFTNGVEILHDIVPNSIGILSHGEIIPIVKEGEKIPTKKTISFKTLFNNQTEALFEIYEGQGKYPGRTNKNIGNIILKNLNGNGQISLKVEIKVEKTGKLTIKAYEEANENNIESIEVVLTFKKTPEELRKMKEHFDNFL